MPGPQPCHCIPFIFCIAGRGLDPSGASGTPPPTTIRRASHYRKHPRRPGGRPPYIPLYHIPWGGPSPATHSRHPVGPGMPGPQPCHCIPFIFCIVGRGLDPSGGVGDAAPYNNPQGFSLPQTSAAAWGQAALHPTLPHSVGRAFARNSFTPPRRGMPGPQPCHCIPFIFAS